MLNVLWLVGMMFASQWGLSVPMANNTEKGLLGGAAIGAGVGRNSDAGVVGAIRLENRIVACWDDRVHHGNDTFDARATVPMLKGSVYLHCGETKKTMCAKGTVLVEAFDNQARKLAQWQFDAASLEKLKRTDLIGVGYSLCLPLDQRCLGAHDIQLKLTYRGADGMQCCDEPTRLRMRFDSLPVVQAVHTEIIPLSQVAPVSGSCDSTAQVQFSVIMAHVSPAGMKHFNIEARGTSGGFQYGILQRKGAPDVSLQSMQEQGLMRIIARPNIITLSGRLASFQCRSEKPMLLQASDTQIRYRQDGIHLDLLPTVTNQRKIRLEVCPHIATADNKGIVKQIAKLTTELNDGQTLVVVGSDNGEKQKLVIMVTPNIVGSANTKASKQMSFTDIATLSKRGISDDIIIRQMQLTESMFDLTTEQILSLHEAGVSNAIIRAMQERRVPLPQPRTFTWPVEERFRF